MRRTPSEPAGAGETVEKQVLVCVACGYGICVRPGRAPRCPMCGLHSWGSSHRRQAGEQSASR